jgi:hypothetical protein
MSGLNVLLLCSLASRDSKADTHTSHINAFERHSRHNVFRLSNTGPLPSRLDLERFDVVVIHYSIWVTSESHLPGSAATRIAEFPGLKVQFRQDEFFTVDAMSGAMRRLGIDVLYTCVPPAELDKVYLPQALPDARRITTLTGFVPDEMLARKVAPIAERPLDVSYRASKPPYALGELAVEKWRIVPRFLEATARHGLVTDLAYGEEQRLFGEEWIALLASSKCTLGAESGASVFDFTGEIQRAVERYLAEHPQAGFEEVRDRIFAAEEGRIRVNQISPRCFEAAALRTAMILYEGEYSGILEPWRHYVPLKKDFSNIEEVVAAIRNPPLLQAMVDRAYREIALNPAYSHRHFIAGFDDAIEQEFGARGKARARRPYTRAAYRFALCASPGYALRAAALFVLRGLLPGTRLRKLLHRMWYGMPIERRARMGPLLKLFGKTDIYIPKSGKS